MTVKSPNRSGYFTIPVAPDFLLEIAKGKMPGYRSNQILGINTNVDDSYSAIWGNTDEPFNLLSSSGAELFISSTSVNDTVEIEIDGLDLNFVEKTVIVALNGQTPVSIGTFLRINKMRNHVPIELEGAVWCAEAGSTTGGVPDDKTLVQDVIPFDIVVGRSYSISTSGIFSVPAGHTLFMFIARIYVENLTPGASARFCLIRESCVNQAPGLLFCGDLSSGPSELPLSGFRIFPEKTTLSFGAHGSASGFTVSISIDSVLIEDEQF